MAAPTRGAPQDSGLLACAYPLSTHDVAATAYPKIRAQFAGSRWPDLCTAGTAYVDLAMQLSTARGTDGYKTVWFYQRLSAVCAHHGNQQHLTKLSCETSMVLTCFPALPQRPRAGRHGINAPEEEHDMALFIDFHDDPKLPAEAIAQIAADARNAKTDRSASAKTELYHNPDGSRYCLLEGPDEDANRARRAALGVPCGDVHRSTA